MPDENPPLPAAETADLTNVPANQASGSYEGFYVLLKTKNPNDAAKFVKDMVSQDEGPNEVEGQILSYSVGVLTLESLELIKLALQQSVKQADSNQQ